jgi:phage-related protein
MKALVWLGSTLAAMRAFSKTARQQAGYQLYRVQSGLDPSDWKPLRGLGSGIREIRIRVENQYRVVYVAKFPEAVYVLHAFAKKTAKTSKKELTVIAMRYQELQQMRKKSGDR